MELSFFEKLFPGRAANRYMARERAKYLKQRYFDGGKASPYRPVNPGLGPDTSPQAITQDGSESLRRYARNLDENNDLAISVLDTLVNNIIGTGIPVIPAVKNRNGEMVDKVNQQIRRIFQRWSRYPTADQGQNFAQVQRLLCRSWLRDGEVFIHELKGNSPSFTHMGGIPYTLEMLESDYVPFGFNESKPRLITQGIQMNAYYQPLAYYFARQHPGDTWFAGAGIWTSESDFTRIEADDILHLKFTRRINQVRGQSILHGVIRQIEDIGNYTESELIAARVAAAFTGFIKKSPDVNQALNQDTGDRNLQMQPGMIFDNLMPGEEVGTIDPGRPNPEMNNFVSGLQRRVASGTSTNYSTISKNYEGSYSSQRQSMVEAKAPYDALRDHFVDRFILPVYEQIIDWARTSGELVMSRDYDQETLYDVMTPRSALPWIDPKKEVEADILRIDNGLAARSQVISERGQDPVAVAKQHEADKALFPDYEGLNDVDSGAGNEDAENETEDDSEDTATQS